MYKELERQEKLAKEIELSNPIEKKSNLTRDKVNKLNLNQQIPEVQIDNFSSASFKTGLTGASFSSTLASATKLTKDKVIYQKYV